MPILIHEFQAAGSAQCGNWRDGDGLTAAADAVTCSECRQRQADADTCPSHSMRDSKRCLGRRGHDGLHHCEAYGIVHAWTDETSPAFSWELHQPT
jgi:hypothetical protein